MNKNINTAPIQSDSLEIIPNIQKVAEFIQFVQWLATPSYTREIKTQKEFANSIGVNQDTLTDWKKHPKLWELVHKQTSTWIKERIPDVIEGLYNNACGEGKAKDVITFLQLAGMDIKN